MNVPTGKLNVLFETNSGGFAMKTKDVCTLLPSRTIRLLLIAMFAALFSVSSWASGGLPVAVSPGSSEGVPMVAEQCPTFLWGTVSDAESYELIVYQLPEEDQEAADVQERVVLRKKLPGSAHGWTPSLDQCLEAGVRYAWTVRAIGRESETEWAEPTFFRVSDVPSVAEVQAAVRILQRYLAKADPKTDTGREPQLFTESAERPSATAVATKVLATAPAALHAEPSAISGEVVGVRGVVNSSGGAAGVFNNTAGGKILSGLSSGTEVFNLNSSGAVSAASFSGDGTSLSNVTAADLSCTSCVGSTDLGSNSVGSSEIQTGAVGSSEVLNNSLTSSDLTSNSVGASEIQSGAVGSSEVNSSQVQLRVSGSCPAGSSVGLINSNGTVVCEPDDIKGWQRVSFSASCPNNNNCWTWVGCSSGKRVLGGGVELPGVSSGLYHLVTMAYSRPRDDISWEVAVNNTTGSTITMKTWAVCSPAVN